MRHYRGKRTDLGGVEKEDRAKFRQPYEVIATPPGTTLENVLTDLAVKREVEEATENGIDKNNCAFYNEEDNGNNC